jgi:hypothetical protein
MREIAIGNPGPIGLLLYLCDLCRQQKWLRDGHPVSAREALETARSMDAGEPPRVSAR